MTNEEKAWEIIKGMHISGPWQEHIAHKAVVAGIESVEPKWIDINETHPEDGQRVLTWNKRFEEARIQVFNKSYECWDTEDGDDYEYDLDTNIIQYWMPLPTKPE